MSDNSQDPWSCANFVVQIIVAIGTLGAVFVAIWGEWFRSKLAAPRLSIEIEDVRGVLGEGAEGRKAIYYHMRVINSRAWATARRCRVLLREVHCRGPDQQFHAIPMPVPIPFHWAPRGYAPLEVDLSARHGDGCSCLIARVGSPIDRHLFARHGRSLDKNRN
jgi:hypothetical protein